MSSNTFRIQYLDVLKAVAILSVLLYHSGYLPYGYLGVDIFLVIAGYLTTKSLLRKDLNFGGYLSFEISRIIRLLPPLLLAGVFCMALGWFSMIDDTYESLSQSVIATNFFGNNIVELIASGDYWRADIIFSPLMHTWYVGLVMQFYLVYPLLFIIAKQINKDDNNLCLIKIIIAVAVISLFIFWEEQDSARRFYLLSSRFFEFAIGGLLAFIPQKVQSHSRFISYLCYALLIVLLVANGEFVSAQLKLLMVVALTSILILSGDTLENKVTGNVWLARIGAASYSIFVWHQVILAFYRSIAGSHFTLLSYWGCLVAIALMSWLSYKYVEQVTTRLHKEQKGTRILYWTTLVVFLLLNVFTFGVYKNAGVVRDIPELEVKLDSPQRGKWAAYNSRNLNEDHSFITGKEHWFVIGNSYARDFINIIKESGISDKVEVSYCECTGGNFNFMSDSYDDRFQYADKIFISSKSLNEKMIREIEIRAIAFGHDLNDVIVVGEKEFGETMTQVYVRRFSRDYYNTLIHIKKESLDNNMHFKHMYGNRYLDLLGLIVNNEGEVRAFTDDNMFISSDCIHLTKAGAKMFANKIQWNQFLQ